MSKSMGVSRDKTIMDNDDKIPCYYLIWTAGVTQNKLISDLQCEHDKSHGIITNEYLEMKNYENIIYVLGDCVTTLDLLTA